jgi:hypothetical protein
MQRSRERGYAKVPKVPKVPKSAMIHLLQSVE